MHAIRVAIAIEKESKLYVRANGILNNAIKNLSIHLVPDDRLALWRTLQHAIQNRHVHGAGFEHLALKVISSIRKRFPSEQPAS
jgi:hypothetical protein